MYTKDGLPVAYFDHLHSISPDAQKILIQYYGLQGTPELSLEEIAELRRDPDIDTNAVRGAISMAVKELREAYEKHVKYVNT